MTIRQYISQKLQPFGTISEAQLLDMSLSGNFGLDDEYHADNARLIGTAIIGFIEEMVFSPKLSSINESGFSLSWDFSGLGKYYLWLCRKYGVDSNPDVAGSIGVSMIINRTNIW